MASTNQHNGINSDSTLLKQKEAELQALQSSFDEYIESSRQIEEELENEIETLSKSSLHTR